MELFLRPSCLTRCDTQQEGQAELDRLALAKASADRRKQLPLNNPQLAQEEREKQSQIRRNNRN